MEMDPPAGDAPAESHYKCNPQAAAWRRITELTYQTSGLLYVRLNQSGWFCLTNTKPFGLFNDVYDQ
jgi:hypothetical protein